jgi:hypothetical protein
VLSGFTPNKQPFHYCRYWQNKDMGSHPLNLTIRFLLEVLALVALGVWGWQQQTGWLRLVLAFGLPVLAAAVWGTFAVPNDPSRSAAAPVPIPGLLRLLLEAAIFGLATLSLFMLGAITLGLVFGIAVVIHYLVSYDRVMWLLSR